MQPTRAASGLREGKCLERLENRLALAVVNPFDVRFTANDTGDITFAANTIMTAPGDSPEAVAARNGTGPANTLNDDYWNMVYIDIDGDPATFNSSAATLDLPDDADVLFAGLYWGGRARGADQFAAWKNVKFRGPDDGGYQNLTSLDADFSSTPQGAPTGSGAQNYQGFKDVTDLVRAQGEGTYTVANVQAYQDNNYSAGWALVVAYRAPNELARNLTVFDGFAYVTTSDPDVTIPVSGFLAPPSGPVNATIGFVAYEGDLGITGDRAFFNGGLGESQLSNATNPANNFFNSSISDRGVTVTSKNPNYVNQLGFGADLVEVDSLIANGSTSATVRLTTTQDFYYPGVITSAIELYAPKIGVTKTVEDVNGGEVIAGDVLRYTVTVANAAGALDTAVNVILDDMIPTNTTYKPGSLVISTGPNSGSKTDAVDGDQGEFLFGDNAVRFQLGTGAGGGVGVPIGGTLLAGEFQTVTFEVIVDPDVIEGTVIRNIASAGFAADTSGFLLGATSNSVEVVCRPSAVLSITKADSPETVTAGGEGYTYEITVTNSGPSSAQNVVVVDDLPAGFVATAFSGPGTLPSVGTDPFTWTIGTLAKGATVALLVTYRVEADVEPGTYRNTATATSPTDKGGPRTAFCDTDVVKNVDLELDKVTVTPVVAGQLVSYTIAISNSGKSDVTGAVVTDPFAGVLSGVTWTAVFSGGSGNLSGSGNISESINLSAGGSVLYSVTGLLASSATGSLVNTATVTSPFDTATDTVTDAITGLVDLDVTKTGDITYKGGGPLNFTVIVTNNGPSFASGVRVVDALPAGVVSWSWTVTYTGTGSGTADGSPDSVTASTAGIDKLMNLAVLGTATFSITALTSDFKSDISNTATASIGQESATATWTSAYDGPINPTADVAALIIGTDDGCGIAPWVRIVDPITGTILSQFLAYEPGFRGGVRVTSGDMDGDGIAEIIVAPGRNRIGQIRVFTPQGVELTAYRTFPFGAGYRGGVEVAVGDVDGDGDNDIIASMSTGMPMVRVFAVTPGAPDPVANVPFRSFRAFPAPYANGTMIAAGDFGTYFNGVKTSAAPDGVAEIVTGTNSGTRAWTRIWDVSVTPKVVRGAFVIAPGFRGGVTLSTARWDADTVDDLIVGAGIGGNSIVEVYSGATGGQLARLTAFSSFVKTNARAFAAALDLTGDGIVDNLYGVKGLNGGGGARGVRQYARSSGIVSQLTSSPLLAPPLRIAPITLRVPG